MKVLLLISLAAAIAGPSLASAADAALSVSAVNHAEDGVRAQLKDPESARFTRLVGQGDSVCGFYNAKNSLGGYVGALPFIASTAASTDGKTYVVSLDDGVDPHNYTIDDAAAQQLIDMWAAEWLKACGSTFVP